MSGSHGLQGEEDRGLGSSLSNKGAQLLPGTPRLPLATFPSVPLSLSFFLVPDIFGKAW